MTLTHSEVNSIREVASAHLTAHVKLAAYATQCEDTKIKKMFETASQGALTASEDLTKLL